MTVIAGGSMKGCVGLLIIGAWFWVPDFVGAQGRRSVQGDAYIVTKNGDIKRAAANEIFLLLATDTSDAKSLACKLVVAQEHASLQQELISKFPSAGSPDAQTPAEARTRPASALHEFVRQRRERFAPTNVAGHFQFAGVKPGTYTLLGIFDLNDYDYVWWVTTEVKTRSVTVDLDNNALLSAIEGKKECALKRTD